MKKTTKIVLIVLVVVAIVVALTFVFLEALRKSLSAPVADYDTRIEIWNTVAGNSSHSKLDNMNGFDKFPFIELKPSREKRTHLTSEVGPILLWPSLLF